MATSLTGITPHHINSVLTDKLIADDMQYVYNDNSRAWDSAPVAKKICADELEIGGRDIGEAMDQILDRLAILEPNMEKIEKFEALRKAYDHYKMIEKMCFEVEADK